MKNGIKEMNILKRNGNKIMNKKLYKLLCNYYNEDQVTMNIEDHFIKLMKRFDIDSEECDFTNRFDLKTGCAKLGSMDEGEPLKTMKDIINNDHRIGSIDPDKDILKSLGFEDATDEQAYALNMSFICKAREDAKVVIQPETKGPYIPPVRDYTQYDNEYKKLMDSISYNPPFLMRMFKWIPSVKNIISYNNDKTFYINYNNLEQIDKQKIIHYQMVESLEWGNND